MSSISFFHIATPGKKVSTEIVVSQIRKFHPHEYYMLMSDNADDLSDIAKKYDCDYIFDNEHLGYPGYDSIKILKWLNRFYIAAKKCNTSHMMMVEDDVWIKKRLTINDNWEMACFNVKVGNMLPEPLIEMIEKFSGKKPIFGRYGAGGGSIFNVETFVNNYNEVTKWFHDNTDLVRKYFYPELGYMDCFMTVYYFLCGKDYSVNPHLTDTDNRTPNFDYDNFVNTQSEEIEIIHNYKKYYWV